jgi:hypothetical protein
MPSGGVEVLTRSQFEKMFPQQTTMEARKEAAVAFGERCRCDVAFVGGDDMYVRFTRRPGPQSGA